MDVECEENEESKEENGIISSESDDVKTISNKIDEEVDSVENDRSFQEIEITNSLPPCEKNEENDDYEFIKSLLDNLLNDEMFNWIDCKYNNKSKFLENKSVDFNLFEGISLTDSLVEINSNSNEGDVSLKPDNKILRMKIKQLEEAIALKDTILMVLNSEVESLRELQSSSSTLNSETLTEYKQLQEEFQKNRGDSFNNILEHKDQLIQQLMDSLQQSINKRNQMEVETEKFLNEIDCLKKKLIQISDSFTNTKEKNLIDNHVQTDNNYKEENKIAAEEMAKLTNQLEQQHSKEMEQLRTYFEVKCLDLEKNYSEQVLTNRRSSNQTGNLIGPGGDSVQTKNIEENLELNLILKEIHESNLKKNFQQQLLLFLENTLQLHDEKTKILKEEYEDKIKKLEDKIQLLTESISSKRKQITEEYELAEVVQSYERRLQEQIISAKVDIINALEDQIQILVSNPDDETEWPIELVQLRDRFNEKYEKKIAEMIREHDDEIIRLKEEHLKNLNRIIKRRSLRDCEDEIAIIQERDNLRNCSSILRLVVVNLIKYFTQCEEQLNNTLVEEIFKQVGVEEIEDDQVFTSTKRVHIAPKMNEILTTLDQSMIIVDLNEFSVDLEKELSDCLNKLKDEANGILKLTSNLKKNQNKTDNVEEAFKNMKILEKEKLRLEKENDKLIRKLRYLENEVKSDIFGCIIRSDEFVSFSSDFDEAITSLDEVQNKARKLIVENRSDNQSLLQLIDDLCMAAEKLKRESTKDHIDLKRQIETADKKIRANAVFIEEQAAEREQERDDALKKIDLFKDQLREREKDRVSYERIVKEVEQLEQQMREMSKLMDDNERRTREIEIEREEAFDKNQVLREIIRDLELQIEAKISAEEEHKLVINQLKSIIEQQNQSNQELNYRLDSIHNVEHINEHVERLENEMQNLKLNAELIGKEGLLYQIKTELNDLEMNLEKRTFDLEGLHAVITTSCSSPSEDISVRDQIRPRAEIIALEECHVPLQQLARLKEKLVIHSRAEDAAIKKIKDLEMQLEHLKTDLEETQNEKDILQEQVSQQLVLISSLEMRLDEQRLRNEQVQKQSNSSLEARVYDLENEVETLKVTLQNKEKIVKSLKEGIEQTKTRLELREKELQAKVEEAVYIEQLKQIEKLQEENSLLKNRIDCDVKNAQMLPNLVDNIIADKNKDIEALKEKLSETQKELEVFLSLNLDRNQIESLCSLKSSEKALSEFISFSDLQVRKEKDRSYESLQLSGDICSKKIYEPNVLNDTVFHSNNPPEFELIENDDFSSFEKNKRVRFEDGNDKEQLKKEIKLKNECISDLEKKIAQLENELIATENKLTEEKNSIDKEKELLKSNLKRKDEELEFLKKDLKRQDEMYTELTKEKRELEKRLHQLLNENERYRSLMIKIEEKNEQIAQLESEVLTSQDSIRKFKDLEDKRDNVEIEKNSLKEDLKEKNNQIKNYKELNEKQTKELSNKEEQIDSLAYDLEKLKESISENKEELNKVKNENVSLKKTMYNDEKKSYENLKLQRELAEKELEIIKFNSEIDDLKYEINHLQHLLREKEKIISQMREDTRILHLNLETIQNKMRETGNVVELKKKLTEEQQSNAVLRDEIRSLKDGKNNRMTVSIEEITGQVQQQLDYSAMLDSKIMNALNNDDEIARLKISNEQLDREIISLKEKCDKSEKRVIQLDSLLEREKIKFDKMQLENAEVLEEMRNQLESALENKACFENLLKIAENKFKSNNNSDKTELTQYKSLPIAVARSNDELLIENLMDENKKFRTELKSVKKTNEEINNYLKFTKAVLKFENQQVENLEKKCQQNERELLKFKIELEERNRLVEYNKNLIIEMEQEGKTIKKQYEELLRNFDKKSLVPEKLLKKINELKQIVKDQVKEIKKMSEELSRLTDERQKLQVKVNELETCGDLPFDDVAGRANYLFARYLKAESNRKALIWQKQYLLSLLITYQNFAPSTARNNVITPNLYRLRIVSCGGNDIDGRRTKRSKNHRFKIVAIGLIVIARLKYLVRRWHTGTRFGAHLRTTPLYSEKYNINQLEGRTLENNSNSVRLAEKISSSNKNYDGNNVLPTLNAPRILLTEYLERFDQIQEKLGIAVENNKLI